MGKKKCIHKWEKFNEPCDCEIEDDIHSSAMCVYCGRDRCFIKLKEEIRLETIEKVLEIICLDETKLEHAHHWKDRQITVDQRDFALGIIEELCRKIKSLKGENNQSPNG